MRSCFSAGQYGELLALLLMTHPAESRDWHGDLCHDMVTAWCQRARRPRIVGSMAQKGDCGRKSQSKKSSSFSDDSLGIPSINKTKKYESNEVIPINVLDYSTFARSTCTLQFMQFRFISIFHSASCKWLYLLILLFCQRKKIQN